MTERVRDTNPDHACADYACVAAEGTAFCVWCAWQSAEEALRSERAGREKAETALRIAAGALEIASQHATGHDVVLASEVELRGVASSALEIVWAVLAGEGDTDE